MHLGVMALPLPGPGFWGFPPKLHACPLHATPLTGYVCTEGGQDRSNWPTPSSAKLTLLSSGRDGTT